jgi:hypothetical protein
LLINVIINQTLSSIETDDYGEENRRISSNYTFDDLFFNSLERFEDIFRHIRRNYIEQNYHTK